MLNVKVVIIQLIIGLVIMILYKMSPDFPKPYEPFGRDINVKVYLSNYATKADLKNAIGTDTSKLAAKTVPDDLSNLKSKVDKLNIDYIAPVPVD